LPSLSKSVRIATLLYFFFLRSLSILVLDLPEIGMMFLKPIFSKTFLSFLPSTMIGVLDGILLRM